MTNQRVWRIVRRTLLIAAIVLAPHLPGISSQKTLVQYANLAGEWSLIAISLVLLTGWVGQISLGQGAFVGIGAFLTGQLARGAGIPFPLNLPIVALASAAVAGTFGVMALRVRGLYLAVATLIFAYMAQAFLFSNSFLVGPGGGASTIPNHPIGRRGTFTFFDFTSKETFYLVIVAAVAGAWYAAVNLRDSKTGRAFFAVRGSETAAVSLGIDVTKYKLMAFAISGALAGIAGNLQMTDLRTVTPVEFQFTASLTFLGIAVVGGISSLGGAVAASGLFAFLFAIGQLWSNNWAAKLISNNLDLVSVALLLVVLLVYPGGLSALGRSVRGAMKHKSRKVNERVRHKRTTIRAAVRPRRQPRAPRATRGVVQHRLDYSQLDVLEPEPSAQELAIIGEVATQREHVDWRALELPAVELPAVREEREPLLEAFDVTVRFGGLTAASEVSLSVRTGEIVGLIGPNGAGKTTTFNAIAGLNEPSSGSVRLYGEDVTKLPVHLRAQMGVGRTFQLIQLFPQLSVFENLLVATHVHNGTGALAHVLLTDRAVEAEVDSRKQVRQIVSLMGLEDVADRKIAGLPFGILRNVEIARALVTRAPLLMLDEPASGLDNNETEEFARLLRFIRAQLGVSILLIEHDVRLVTSVCDYIYVINRGSPLAEGTAAEIQRNPDVIAAYLGEAETAPVAI